MPTLRSLDDLRSLLPEGEEHNQSDEPSPTKLGYDGKPQRLDVRLDSKKRLSDKKRERRWQGD